MLVDISVDNVLVNRGRAERVGVIAFCNKCSQPLLMSRRCHHHHFYHRFSPETVEVGSSVDPIGKFSERFKSSTASELLPRASANGIASLMPLSLRSRHKLWRDIMVLRGVRQSRGMGPQFGSQIFGTFSVSSCSLCRRCKPMTIFVRLSSVGRKYFWLRVRWTVVRVVGTFEKAVFSRRLALCILLPLYLLVHTASTSLKWPDN